MACTRLMWAAALALKAAAVQSDATCQPSLLPQPASISTGNTTSLLGASFSISCVSGGACSTNEILSNAFQRYINVIFNAGVPAPSQGIQALSVQIEGSVPLTVGVDESYALTVSSDQASLTAATEWGALRGLETFSQVVSWQKDYSGATNGTYSVPCLPISITDAPRWPWRGVLVDTSRHYQPLPVLLSIVEAMSYNKLNVLHWHAVDDQSWPLVSAAYPNFSAAGAFAPDAVYSKADVTTLVSFARARGIMVIPEFDMPGHASIWGQGYPDLVISCPTGQTLLNPVPSSFSGTSPDVYTVLAGLLAEFVPLFNSPPIIHLGGDEVFNTTCWNASTEVLAWAASNSWTQYDMHAVRDSFESRVQAVVAAAGARTMFWEEVWNGNFTLRPDAIVNAWLNTSSIEPVLQSGRQVVSAYGLYLNRAQPQAPFVPVHYAFQDTWQDFYKLDPTEGLNKTMSPAQLSNFLGQTISQWAIQYAAGNIEPNLWPRASAAAERSWSPANVTDVASAEARMEAHACRMVQRGVPSGPLGSSYCPTKGFPGMPPTPAWAQAMQLAVPARG